MKQRCFRRTQSQVACWAVSALLIWFGSCSGVAAADANVPAALQKKIDASLARAVAWLRAQSVSGGDAAGSLIWYALLKAKTPPDTPMLIRHRDMLLHKIDNGCYGDNTNPQHHVYEAGCDAMFLEALDPALYAPQLTEIRDYLLQRQLPNGGWHYPSVPVGPTGDTSITQYGVLGLWAVQRAGIDVPREVWSKVAKFHEATQRGDGGFSYHPYDVVNASSTSTTASMSAAGLGSTLVSQLMLYGSINEPTTPEPPPKKRFGVLEQLAEKDVKSPRKTVGEAVVGRDFFKKIVPAAERAVERLFNEGTRGAAGAPHPIYFLYGCERAGAILDSTTFGNLPWYERGAEFLIERQDSAGFWDLPGNYNNEVKTAFAILFLSRATKSLVPRPKPVRKVGAGLLVGGRGLPTDLANVSIDDGAVKRHVPKQGVDTLLSDLEQPGEASVQDLQQSIVEAVDLDRPEELVGQTERLHRLIDHPQSEVRQVAVWAIARSGDLSETPRLIALLNDPDVVVAWEASLGLCVISRLPTGVTPVGGSQPLPVRPPGAGAESAAPDAEVDSWRTKAIAAWDAWYQRVRPYDERDDRRQIRSR